MDGTSVKSTDPPFAMLEGNHGFRPWMVVAKHGRQFVRKARVPADITPTKSGSQGEKGFGSRFDALQDNDDMIADFLGFNGKIPNGDINHMENNEENITPARIPSYTQTCNNTSRPVTITQ